MSLIPKSTMSMASVAGKSAIVAAIAIPALAKAFAKRQNSALVLTETEVGIPRLPAELDGFRIIHLSDLHDASFGRGQERLVEMIEGASPDLIALTGDMIDGETSSNALTLARRCATIAPTVSVTGNHESYSAKTRDFLYKMEGMGICCLNDEVVDGSYVAYGNSDLPAFERLEIIGLSDPAFASWEERIDPDALMDSKLARIAGTPSWQRKKRGIRILLSHRPEYLPSYAAPAYGIDLALVGHAHGGQWRIPRIGGLYAPSQGILPKLTEGTHRMGRTQMVISRGLGNSGFPLRLNNKPEVVAITLRHVEDDGPQRLHSSSTISLSA